MHFIEFTCGEWCDLQPCLHHPPGWRFTCQKTLMNLNHLWTNESLSSGLRMAWLLESPSCYLSAVFVVDLAALSRQASALVQPCQDQVELERKKGKKKADKSSAACFSGRAPTEGSEVGNRASEEERWRPWGGRGYRCCCNYR